MTEERGKSMRAAEARFHRETRKRLGAMARKVDRAAEFAKDNDEAVHQIALLTEAVYDLLHSRPSVRRKGVTMLKTCVARLKQLAEREKGES